MAKLFIKASFFHANNGRIQIGFCNSHNIISHQLKIHFAIKGQIKKEKLLIVKCFGNFEVYAKNEKVVFKRLKSKELFAFLVDRNGAGMTAKQISAVLFADDADDTKNSAYIRQLVMDLKNALKNVGAERVLCHETPCYRIDTTLIKCDYISYLETGRPEFFGEYMTQYSWAEDTCAMLQFKK